MQLIANDLSVHGQFHDYRGVRESFGTIHALRAVAKRFGRDIQCSRDLLYAEPLEGVPMSQAIGRLSRDQRRSMMSWLTSAGPFWDDLRQHGPDDFLECAGEIVTDSAVGEAAFRSLHAVQCALVSFVPSDWDHTPVEVALRHAEDEVADRIAMLPNWRTVSEAESGLAEAGMPMNTWTELQDSCAMRFTRLHLADDSFAELAGVPFARSSAERIFVLLGILDRRARAFDASGAPTTEARHIHKNYFSGENALFSDSSNTEKRDFHDRLTFPHPANPGESLWCPWHGKEHRSTLRLHFSWPFRPDEPVYVVYVGPKLTKR